MSLLVILLGARPQDGPDAPGSAGLPNGRLHHVFSPDGVTVTASAWAEAKSLPRADTVVAVLPPTAVAWHRTTLPKAPPARLRQALASVLEEQLLDEPDDTHLAIAPHARPGEPCWVGATHRATLTRQLSALEAAGVMVDRVVPSCAPNAVAAGHFYASADAASHGDTEQDAAALWLNWSDPHIAVCLRAAGSLARSLLPADPQTPVTWTATPAANAAAERWLGHPVPVQTDAEHMLAATRSEWNLRQFELAAHTRGLRAVRGLGKQMLGPSWRWVRWGVAALLLVQLLGVNLWAWRQKQRIEARQQDIVAVINTSHPQVKSIIDAPVQMRRETETLRAAAGRAGDDDLETLLGLAAAAWPDGRPPIDKLKFETGRLTLPAAGWDAGALQALRGRIEAAGGKLESNEADLIISRPPQKAGP